MKHSLVVVAALALGTAQPAWAQAVLPTYLACELGTGARPVAIAAADFDRNGSADIAILDGDGDRVVVLLTDPALFAIGACREGTQTRTVTVGTAPRSLAVGDLDGNGTEDMVVVYSRFARVLAGDGFGGFTPQQPIQVAAEPQGVVTGDFDGDGFQDFIVGTGDGQTIETLYGISGGGFLSPVSTQVGQTVTAMVADDFNLDGRLDVALLSTDSGTVTVLLRDEVETRAFVKLTPFAVGAGPTAIATGDFDRNGKPDLAVTAEGTGASGDLAIFLGNGSGTFVGTLDLSTGANPAGLALGKLTPDDYLDAVVVNEGDDTVGFYVGGASPDLLTGQDPCDDSCADGCCFSTGPRVVALALLDADVLDDVVVGSNQNGTVTFFLSSDPPSTPTRTPTPTRTSTPTPSLTPTISQTPTITSTVTRTVTLSPTPSRTDTPSRTPTETLTQTPGPFALQGESCAIDGGRRGGNFFLPLLVAFGFIVLRSLWRAVRRNLPAVERR